MLFKTFAAAALFASNFAFAQRPSFTRSAHFDAETGILTWEGPAGTPSPLEQQDGTSFQAGFGLMVEGDVSHEALKKRSRSDTRDVERREVELELTERGEILGLDVHLERFAKRDMQHSRHERRGKKKSKKGKEKSHHGKKKSKKNKKKAKSHPKSSNTGKNVNFSVNSGFSAFITWYTGVDLQNPYCADGSGWTPTDNSLISAVTIDWGSVAGGRPPCGSFLQLKAPAVNKAVIVRVVDMCGGCQPNVPHVDLSLRAFKQLYDLDVGKVADIQVSYVGAPFDGPWDDEKTALYGPKNL